MGRLAVCIGLWNGDERKTVMSNQKSAGASAVTMDARKFLRMINEGIGAKNYFFEKLIQRLGEEQGQKWALTTLHPTCLVYEDVERNIYYHADLRRTGNRVVLENVQRVEIVEEKKEEVFNKFCDELIDALAEDDQRGAEVAFGKIESCRFRPSVIPPNGMVKTRDGRVHRVPVVGEAIDGDGKKKLIEHAVKVLRSNVQVKDGRMVSATVTESNVAKEVTLPIDELTRRRVVARQMKEVAQQAYAAAPFQEHVETLAGLVSESRINEAVQRAAEYAKEYQEFALLSGKESHQLVENALSAVGCFNHELTEDVAKVFHKTCIRINQKNILEAWEHAAKKAEYPPLLTQVKDLQSSKNFEEDYDKFLGQVFNENTDVRDVRRLSYLNSMKLIQNLAQPEDPTIADQLSELITRLEDQEVDDAAIREAEDLLASISDELLQATTTLDEFDKIPGSEEGAEEPAPELPGGELGGPPEGEVPPVPGPEMAGESTEVEAVPISEMTVEQLREEFASWEVEHEKYVSEDGIAECMTQLNEYVERATAVEDEKLLEGFRQLRDLYAKNLAEEKSYFSTGMKKMNVKPDLNYTKVGKQYPLKGKLSGDGHEMDRVGGDKKDHPLNKKSGGLSAGEGSGSPEGKGIAKKEVGKIAEEIDKIANQIEGEDEEIVSEGVVKCAKCGVTSECIGEEDVACPKCGMKMTKPGQVAQAKPPVPPSPAQPGQPPVEKEDQYKGPNVKPLGMMRSSVNPVDVNKFESKQQDGKTVEEGIGSDKDIDETVAAILGEMALQEQDASMERKDKTPKMYKAGKGKGQVTGAEKKLKEAAGEAEDGEQQGITTQVGDIEDLELKITTTDGNVMKIEVQGDEGPEAEEHEMAEEEAEEAQMGGEEAEEAEEVEEEGGVTPMGVHESKEKKKLPKKFKKKQNEDGKKKFQFTKEDFEPGA